ncbi:LamG-like jellyroll fold domain-containing protein [Methanocaldococcus sp. 16A]
MKVGKYVLLLALTLLFAGGVWGEQVENGLVAYYSFDNINGNILVDDSGNGHNGVIYGNPKVVEGVKGNALEFDGQSYVHLGDTLTGKVWDAVTVSAVIKPEEQSNNDFSEIFYDGSDGEFALSLRENTVSFNVKLEDKKWWKVSASLPELNRWYHVVGTYSKDEGVIKLYINGILVNKTKIPYELLFDPVTYYGGKYNPTIGAYCDGGGSTNHKYKGAIDELRIYNRVLSDDEIKKLAEDVGLLTTSIYSIYNKPNNNENENNITNEFNQVNTQQEENTTNNVEINIKESEVEGLSVINIDSEPTGAEIYINGKYYGKTPAKIELEPDTYQIEVYKEGYKLYTYTLTTESNKEYVLHITLEKEQTKQQDPTFGGKFIEPPTVVLHMVKDKIKPGEQGIIELTIQNPDVNSIALEGDLIVKVPSNLAVEGGNVIGGGGYYTTKFIAKPGVSKTLTLYITCLDDNPGKYLVYGKVYYYPEGDKENYREVTFTKPIEIIGVEKEEQPKETITQQQTENKESLVSIFYKNPEYLIIIIGIIVFGIVGIAFAIAFAIRK